MGSTWGWGILWKGPFKSGPVSCVCCTLDCQVSGGGWTGQTSSDSGSTHLMLKDSHLCYVCSSLLFPFLFLSSPSPTSLPLPLLLPLLPFSLLPLFFPSSPLDHSLPLPSPFSSPPSLACYLVPSSSSHSPLPPPLPLPPPTHLYRQVSYAIGIAKPLSIYVDTYGTSKLTTSELLDVIEKNFDLRPGVIIR